MSNDAAPRLIGAPLAPKMFVFRRTETKPCPKRLALRLLP